MHPRHHSLTKKKGHAQAPGNRAIHGLLPQILISRDQRLPLRDILRAARWIQRRFFSCRPSARSMLRGWTVMAKRF